MNEFKKKIQFSGIDISKDTIDVALVNETCPGSFEVKKFRNDFNGFECMKDWLKKLKVKLSDCLFCMEHTGTYGLLLFSWLIEKKADFCVVPGLEIKKSLGMVRGKNDQVDARRIATYAMEKKTKLTPFHLPSEELMKIKQLLTFRDQLVRNRTGLLSSVKSHKHYEQLIKDSFVTENIESQILSISETIDKIEEKIKNIISSNPDLKENFTLVTSIKGVGLIIAAYMLVTTCNFTAFRDGRSYACHAGTAPFEHSSGKWKGKSKVSKLGNHRMKTLLSNGSNSARMFDPELRNYYDRKRSEGKDHKLVINSISCKLINRMFSVINRRTPYVTIYGNYFSTNVN